MTRTASRKNTNYDGTVDGSMPLRRRAPVGPRLPPIRKTRGRKSNYEASSGSRQRSGRSEGEPSGYADEMAKEAANFNDARADNVLQYIQHAASAIEAAKERCTASVDALKEKLRAADERHQAGHCCCAAPDLQRREADVLQVLTIDLMTVAMVPVPVWKCAQCQGMSTLHPYAVGYASSKPTMFGRTWFSFELLNWYNHLKVTAGLSATGEVQAGNKSVQSSYVLV